MPHTKAPANRSQPMLRQMYVLLSVYVPGMITLNGPILSLKMFGNVRPNTEPAFKIGTR